MPSFTMAPDISAETWLGASGWARGNHTWSGTTPALEPNPANAARNTTAPVTDPRDGPARRRAAKLSPLAWAARRKKATRLMTSPRSVITADHQPAARAA